VVVLPVTVEQVQQVLRLCQARRIPVVARGAGTGLSGGALPSAAVRPSAARWPAACPDRVGHMRVRRVILSLA
jgi:FAD binding domain